MRRFRRGAAPTPLSPPRTLRTRRPDKAIENPRIGRIRVTTTLVTRKAAGEARPLVGCQLSDKRLKRYAKRQILLASLKEAGALALHWCIRHLGFLASMLRIEMMSGIA